MTMFATPGIGIYTRKSSDKQGELSLPAQERICRKVIVEPSGLPVYRVYKDILSGRRPDRTDYQELLADARSGKLRMVVFHKVNRFGRDAAEGLAAIQELRKLGVEIRIADLPTLDLRKPEGMFIFTFLLGQRQYEVENLGSEARKGMEEKVRRGGWPFRAPDGYQNRHEEVAPRKFRAWIEVDRYRAAIVRLIYTWYASGQTTLRAIVLRLNRLHAQRVACGKRGCLRRSERPWTVRVVWGILINRFYLGEVFVPSWNYQGLGTHTAIIRPALWARVQEVLRAHGQAPQARHSYYRTINDGKRQYYQAETIDRAVLEHIQAIIAMLGEDPVAAFQSRVMMGVAMRRQAVELRLKEIAMERKRLLELGQRGRFTDAEIAGALLRLDGEIAELEQAQAAAERLAAISDTDLEQTLSIIPMLGSWAALDVDSQRLVIEQIVQQVELTATGEVARIIWQPLWDLVAGT